MEKPKGIIFPIKLRFPVVAKFLCHNGMADKWIDFKQTHQIVLEREPTNKYDNWAIKVAIRQAEQYLLTTGQTTND